MLLIQKYLTLVRYNRKYHIHLRPKRNRDGYIRIAPEVYMRIVQNRKASEKQYMVTGEADYQEKTVGVNCPIII